MSLAKLRWLTHLVLVVALASGLVSHGVQAAAMGGKMSLAAANAMPMTGKCDGSSSDGNGCMSLDTCSLICGTALALPTAAPLFQRLPAVPAEFSAVQRGAGWDATPDPYPPRPSILN